MTKAQCINWTVLPTWPLSVHIHDIEGISHPLTPESVRDFYNTSVKKLEVVVWADKASNYLGLKAGISEHVWEQNEIEKLILHFARPAKGAGFIWLLLYKTDGTKEAVANTNSYSDSTFSWFRSVIDSMNALFPIQVEVEDIGYDA